MSNVQEVLRFRDKGPSVEEARRKMLEAGQAPKGIQKETRKNESALRGTGGSTPVVQQPNSLAPAPIVEAPAATTEPEVVAAPAPVAAAPVEVTPQIERTENAKFILEIKQEDGEWVGEITYKNGAGVERFTAPSRNALNLKLLEGKANATLRVREAIRREKYGTELDKVYELPEGVTQEAYNALPEPAQQLLLDTIAKDHGDAFKEAHPEYYPTKDNSWKLQQFLSKRELPITFRNLEFAFAELTDSEELEVRPVAKEAVPSVSAPAPLVEDSTAAAAPAAVPVSTVAAPAASAPAIRKRGTTGLRPGDSSAANTELEQTEESQKPSEPSEAELRKLPLAELQARARKTFKPRQF
jgi:hypothetical protein